MALPGSGQISLGDIAGELGVSLSNVSLRSMSSTAGFSTPDSVSDFYGYSNVTTSDITIYRYATSTSARVSIVTSSFEQSFSSNYRITQVFTVNYYNYEGGYSFNQNYTFYFNFDNTYEGTLVSVNIPTIRGTAINYAFASGTPTLTDYGNPVNLTGWS